MGKKVTVVGAGFYGSTTALRLAEYDIFETVVLTDIVEGKPEGQGVATYANGSVYEGEFLDGRVHGQGRLTYPDGYVYDGDWADTTIGLFFARQVARLDRAGIPTARHPSVRTGKSAARCCAECCVPSSPSHAADDASTGQPTDCMPR